jgi:Ca2+-binding EF-hand superfamily protein
MIGKLRDSFVKLDLNCDGSISRKEMKTLLDGGEYTLSQSAVDALFAGRERVTWREFLSAMCAKWGMSAPTPDEELYHTISENLVDALEEKFSLYDRNGDGSITIEEVEKCLLSQGYNATQEELRQMFDKGDYNQDGKIEWLEFLKMMSTHMAEPPADRAASYEQLVAAFAAVDKEGSGKVSLDIMFKLLTQCGRNPMNEDTVKELLEAADVNSDGYIDYLELVSRLVGSV